MAFRVPVMDASVVDMNVIVANDVTADSVNEAFKKASKTGSLAPYLAYLEEPLVSSDFIGDPHSCSFDSLLTKVIGNLVKIVGWYDNEAGYSNRLADLAAVIGKQL